MGTQLAQFVPGVAEDHQLSGSEHLINSRNARPGFHLPRLSAMGEFGSRVPSVVIGSEAAEKVKIVFGGRESQSPSVDARNDFSDCCFRLLKMRAAVNIKYIRPRADEIIFG